MTALRSIARYVTRTAAPRPSQPLRPRLTRGVVTSSTGAVANVTAADGAEPVLAHALGGTSLSRGQPVWLMTQGTHTLIVGPASRSQEAPSPTPVGVDRLIGGDYFTTSPSNGTGIVVLSATGMPEAVAGTPPDGALWLWRPYWGGFGGTHWTLTGHGSNATMAWTRSSQIGTDISLVTPTAETLMCNTTGNYSLQWTLTVHWTTIPSSTRLHVLEITLEIISETGRGTYDLERLTTLRTKFVFYNLSEDSPVHASSLYCTMRMHRVLQLNAGNTFYLTAERVATHGGGGPVEKITLTSTASTFITGHTTSCLIRRVS